MGKGSCANCGGPLEQSVTDPIQHEYVLAQAAYHKAALRLSDAIVPLVRQKVLAAYPNADRLVVEGYLADYKDGPRLRADRVIDDHTFLVAREGDPEWDNLTEAIDPLLDYLMDIEGEDSWYGEHEIDIT